ncbi:tetratricopeptide repeat-containing sensor histidine kinase [Taibaiella helva]|uniref:tetratricopeptide repeat-containing sensor histidine kinase n=1 Tax=Taibaiella helva TaxID=2301235 RepID=UPI0013004225|nr:ATP-binding protein [Taibaiella helva]
MRSVLIGSRYPYIQLLLLLLAGSLASWKGYSQQAAWPAFLFVPEENQLPPDWPLSPTTTYDYGILGPAKETAITPAQKSRISRLKKTGEALQWVHTDSAMHYFDSAYAESIRIGYYTGVAQALNSRGMTLLGQGRFADSRLAFKRAYYYALISAEKQSLLSALYINLGASYSYQANFEKAFEYYYAGLQYMQQHKADDYNLIMTYNNISDVLIHMAQFEKAAYYLNLGERLMLDRKMEEIYGYIWSNKADLALAGKDYKLSAMYREKAFLVARKYKLIEVQQAVYLVEAKYYLATDQLHEAIVALKKIIEISDATFPLYSLIMPYYTLGLTYYRTGDYKNAEKVLVLALATAHKTGILTDKLEALSTLTKVYTETGRYKEAAEQQKNYIALQDSLNNKEKLKIANELEAKFRTAEKDKNIAEKELLIEKQKRDLEHKNFLISAAAVGAIIFIVLCLGFYWSLKAKNRILAMKAHMEGEENERMRIARELHDGIGGQLAVIKMILSSWPEDRKMQVVALLNETSEQVRQTAHNLMPDFIKGTELAEALTLYVETLNHTFPQLKIDLQIYCKFDVQDNTVKLSIYRMLQEVLQNIIHHSQATEAVVQVFGQQGKLQLLIEDNGIGFDRSKVKAGLGIVNLEARVRMLKGKMELNSAPGRGTTVNIEINK